MLCQECGTNNPDTNNFCGQCGRRLFAKPLREVPVRETVAANQGRVRSTGDALSKLGIANYDYVDVGELAPEEHVAPVAPMRPEPVVSRPSPLSIVPPPEPVIRPAEPTPRTVEPEPVVEDEETVHTTISGPSFLGLTDSSSSDESSYLLQDDAPRSSGGWFLTIVILIILGIVGWLEWPKIKSGEIHIPYLDKLISQANSDSTPAPKQKAVDQADNSDEKLMTNDPTLKDQNLDSKAAENKPAENGAAAASSPNGSASSTGTANSSAPSPPTATNQNSDATKSADAKAAASDSDQEAKAVSPDKPAPSPKSANTKPSARTAKTAGGPDPSQNQNLLLGEQYLYGRGVPQNCNQALKYFRSAAEQENAPAMSHLGAMYASGNCVTMNRVTAYTWLAKAQNADPSNHWRERNMNMLWRDMTPQERSAVSR